jgi:hypothetical protein
VAQRFNRFQGDENMITRKWLAVALLAVGMSALCGEAFAGANVFEFIPGIARTNANGIAQGAFLPTVPDIDWLWAPTFPGSGVCAPNGAFVRSDDLEWNFTPSPDNWGQASARYNFCPDGPARTRTVVILLQGIASGGAPSRDGFSVAAIGDTAVSDSFHVQINPVNATNANVVVNGQMLIQRTNPAPGVGRLDLLVYPDSTTANLDPTRSGAGAIFRGRLIVDKDGIEKADGHWSASDFQVQVTTNHIRVRATALTKAIVAPNTAVLASYFGADASAAAVPASTPVMVTILSLLMAGAGWLAIRRSQVRA